MKMKLYGGKGNRSFRVLWAIEEMGLEFEHVPAAPRSDEVRALNPSGKVPVLLVDGATISDSVAIIQFLADRHGKLTFPAGTTQRALQDSFTQFACDEMDAVLWTAARNSFVLPEEKRVPAIKPTLKWEYARSMNTLAKRLGDKEFLMGDLFTVADIVTVHCANWGRSAGFEIGDETLNAYVDRVLDRPARKRALGK